MHRRTRVGAYAVLTSGEQLLLTQLSRGPNEGKWSLPGGGIEHGESPLETLRREVLEETGLSLPAEVKLITWIDALSVWRDGDEETEVHYLGFVFRAELPAAVLPKEGGDGGSCTGARWFRLGELDRVALSRPTIPVLTRLGFIAPREV